MANETERTPEYKHKPAPQTPVRPGYRIDPKTKRPLGVPPAPQTPVRPGYHVNPTTHRPDDAKPAPQA